MQYLFGPILGNTGDALVIWLYITVIVTVLCGLSVFWLVPKSYRSSLFIVLIGLASIGSTAGIVGGLSREAAAGSIISAALGLVGGVVVYLFAADQSKGTIVSVCAFCFSFTLFLGYYSGSLLRKAPENYIFWRSQCVEKLFNKDVLNDEKTSEAVGASIGELCGKIFNTENKLLGVYPGN